MKFMLYGSFLFNAEFDKSPASLPKKVKKCNMNLKLNYRNTFLSDFRIHIRIFCIDKSISLNHQFLSIFLVQKIKKYIQKLEEKIGIMPILLSFSLKEMNRGMF